MFTLRDKSANVLALLPIMLIASAIIALAQSRDYIYLNGRVIATESPTPPTISGVSATELTDTAGTIVWTTNRSSSSQVDYGLTASYGQSTTLDPLLVTSHSQRLTGLTASTTYHYRVRSGTATSGDYTFVTSAVPDTTPPIISAVTAGSITVSGATITWGTDENADSQVDYGLTSSYGSSSQLNSSMVHAHAVSLSGLTANTQYHYRVRSKDASNNSAQSGDYTFTTLATPAVPTNLRAFAVSNAQINITWEYSGTTGDIIIERRTTGAFAQLASVTVPTTAYYNSGLAPITTYCYRVKARVNGTDSAYSSEVSATTYGLPGNPTAPSDLVASTQANGSITVSWYGSWPDDGNLYYEVWRKPNTSQVYQLAAAVSGTTWTDNGTGAGLLSAYKVRCWNTMTGYYSGYSNIDVATTTVFADDPINVGITTVRAQHISEIRQVIMALRSVAGLSAPSWTDGNLAGVVIKAVHFSEMRSALSGAFIVLGIPVPAFTDPSLSAQVTTIKADHLRELRSAVK
jgi:hypothetical protein